MNPAALTAALSGDFENARIASTPGGIEAQEAAGQAALVASGAQLPKEMHGVTRAQLEAIGFKFGSDIDELFVGVTLPAGWKLKATEHSMHSDLLDANGARRAGIFYKAAFYDRRATITFVPRYYAHTEYAEETITITVRDTASGQDVHVVGSCARRGWTLRDELESQAGEWLKANFPEHTNALAYWSCPDFAER